MALKILVIGPQFPDSFAYSITTNFAAMGHSVKAVDGIRAAHHRSRVAGWFRRNLSRALPRVERAKYRPVIEAARKQQPDLIVVGFATMPPEVVAELKSASNAKLVCWYADAIVNLDRQYLFASPFDAVFSKEPFLVRMLRDKLGMPAHYLPEACNPLAYERVSLTAGDQERYGCDLAAMGTLHYYRARMLELFDGYDLKIWGKNCPPWLSSSMKKCYTHSYVAEGEKAKALLGAKIVLNNINCMEIEGVNGALFQTAGCGAFQIADWKPTLPDLFEPEREIVTFHTRAELKEKVDYYLARPAERLEIADRAYRRATSEHTYQKRLARMLNVMGFAARDNSVVEGVVERLEEQREERREERGAMAITA